MQECPSVACSGPRRSRPSRRHELYGRISFAHEDRPPTSDKLTGVQTQRLSNASKTTVNGLAHATAIATIVRITGGKFRLVDRLVTPIERIQVLNKLDTLTPEVVNAPTKRSSSATDLCSNNVTYRCGSQVNGGQTAWLRCQRTDRRAGRRWCPNPFPSAACARRHRGTGLSGCETGPTS